MLRTALVAAALIALPTAAHAGGYVSAGIGTSPTLGGDVAAMMSTDGHHALRVALGHKLGPAAIEAGIGGFGVSAVAADGSTSNGNAVTASLSVKLQTSLAAGLNLFARAGLERTWVQGSAMSDLSGDGKVLGVGLDYGVSMLASGGVWIELDRQYLDLGPSGAASAGTADTVLVGARFGI